MSKLKLGVIFGGMSTENEISKISARCIMENLNEVKYEIYPIYIAKNGKWYKYDRKSQMVLPENEINDISTYLKQMDTVFPILHGRYGEDGTIQGMLEMLKIPYVGCGVLASSIGMDKVYSKVMFEKANIPQAKYIYIKKEGKQYIYVDEEFNEYIWDINDIVKKAIAKLKFPLFVKASNSGSSIGIVKVKQSSELREAIEKVSEYDNKILIEQGIIGKEVECAVLGNENIIVSTVGEILYEEKFYSYTAKYESKDSKIIIPANISSEKTEEIRSIAKKAFKVIDGKGLARVDFFVEKETEKVYICEINTMPGFTEISMYPKLFEKCGIKYSKLLDKIIELSLTT